MNKPIYLGMSMLDISKAIMYKFWYDYFKPKYGDRAKLCYIDTDSFIINIITEDFFEDISDVEVWYDMVRTIKDLFQQVKMKKVIGLLKDELGVRIMK